MPGIIYKDALRRCRAGACRMRRASFAAHISQGSVDPFAQTLEVHHHHSLRYDVRQRTDEFRRDSQDSVMYLKRLSEESELTGSSSVP